MKAYWLVIMSISQTIVPSFSEPGDESGEENSAKLISNFVKVAVDQLKNDEDFANKVKDVLGDLKDAFSSNEYEGTFIPAVVKMLDILVNNNFSIRPESLLKIMKSVLNNTTREPDKLSNNLRRVMHRSVKTVGDTVKSAGSVGSAMVRVFNDLHNTQREYTNELYGRVPYLGTILQKVNNAISSVLGTVHLIVKVGVKGVGTIISDYAQNKTAKLKEKVAEEKRVRNEARKINIEDEADDSKEGTDPVNEIKQEET